MKNQDLKSSSLFVVIGLFILCSAIVTRPWSRNSDVRTSVIAVQKAEVVGYQIAELYRGTAAGGGGKNSDRGPASIKSEPIEIRETGTVGKDPWGGAYHYRLFDAAESQIKIVVWSLGPNQKVDTLELDNEEKKLAGQPIYQGDDLGVVLTIRQ